jgi:hypothetical protein
MANLILVSSVSLYSANGATKYSAGDTIADSAIQALLTAAGGVLAPANANMTAAAAIAKKLKAQGKNEIELGAFMAAQYASDLANGDSVYSDTILPLLNAATAQAAIDALKAGFNAFRARNVVTINVASLAAFTVADSGGSNDGITNVAGDIVVLAKQTTATQNGPYVVGAVATGAAPLTRPAWFTTGATINSGTVIEMGGEGTLFGNTKWKSMVSASTFVVDTTDGKFYPDRVTQAITLTSGTITKTNVPIFAAAKVNFHWSRTTPTGTSLSLYYGFAAAPTPGVIGTASFSFQAEVAAGTINTADGSAGNLSITNW